MADQLDISAAVDSYVGDAPVRLGAQARFTMANAVGTNPTYEAELRNVAKRTGVPVDTVRAYPEELKKQATLGAYDFDGMAAQFPNATKFLTDQDNASVGHRDVGVLTSLEAAVRTLVNSRRTPPSKGLGDAGVLTNAQFNERIKQLKASNPVLDWDAARMLAKQGITLDNTSVGMTESQRPQSTAMNLLTGLGTGFTESFTRANQGFTWAVADALGMEDVAANAKHLSDQSDARAFLNVPQQGGLGGMVYGGVQSTVQQLPGIAVSIATGNPIPALASIFGTTMGGSYGKYRDRGGSVGQAMLGSGLEGGLEVATEYLPMRFLTDKIGKMGVGEFAKEFFGKELVGEEVNTILTNAVDTAIANPDKTWGQYFSELPGAMVETAVQTLVQTGLLAGASHGLERTVMRAQAAEYRAHQAEQHAQVLEAMQTTMQASEILKHSPDTLRSYAQDLADEGVPMVYVDSAKLTEAGVDLKALAQVMPSVAEQFGQVATGGDFAIPTGELLTNSIGTEFAQGLIDHARTDANGMSRAEAKAYMQEQGDQLNAEIARVMGEHEDDTTFKAGRDEIQGQILQQLNDIQRFTPKVNEQYAALASNFYAVMAARTGMTVQDFANRYKLGFDANTAHGSQVMDQALQSQPPKGWEHVTDGTRAAAMWDGGNKAQAVFWTDLKGKLATDLSEFATYSHSINSSAIQHIKNRHGDADAESSRGGQIAVTPEDVGRVPEIVTSYDAIRSDLRGKHGEPMVAYAKQFEDGVVLYLEAATKKRQNMAGVSMWKYPPKVDVQQVLAQAVVPDHYAQNAVAASGKDSTGGSFYQGDAGDLVAQHNLTAENLLHAVKMGGIPVPSLAVTNKAHPLTGFGEITLVAPSAMVDPNGYAATKVFGADIYSPRYPQVSYELTPAKLKSLKAQFAEGEKATGAEIDMDELGRRGAEELKNSAAVMWEFLTEQGIKPDVKTKAGMDPARLQRLRDFGFEKFFGNTDHQSLMRSDEFQKLVIAEQNDAYTAAGLDDLVVDYEDTKINDWSQLMALSRNPAYEMAKVEKQAEPDGYATRDALRAQIRGSLDDQFSTFVTQKFETLGAKEKIFKGFDNNGNRKYTPHTLENVVKILKTELRGGEGFNYGVGSLRAKFTPQFKSIEQIRRAKGRLMDKAGFEKVKTEVDDELVAISDSLNLSIDQTIEVLEDAPKLGAAKAIERALKDYKRSDAKADPADAQLVAEFLTKLKNLPTEYFEAKILRDVDLAEFKGAVVPEGVNPKVIEALNARGITDIRTYKKGDDADRAAKIGEFGHLFFQDARGQIAFANDITQQASIISLLKNADLSTFIHESGHFFLEVQADLARRITARIAQGEQVTDGERSILDDFNTTLKWMGVTGDENLTPVDQWSMMSADEKRPHHEQFARGFEAYAFEGKAPSLDLQSTFQTFRAWLVNVYRTVKDKLIGDTLNVELNDEVRAVMDRMLATTDAIEEAEAARNMGPLFKTPEEGGMDLEAYKLYHDMGTQATQDAIQELQGKGLRDMQWLQNARSRKLKELQKQHDALRALIAREVKAEVMSQPIYRAWTFLTSKQTEKVVGEKPAGNSKGLNPEKDNLFVAIAKLGGLDRAEVKRLWGIDEKEKLDSGVFGSPVVRKDGGLSTDAMAERLMEAGYLLPDENGKADHDKFEELFDDQRRGTDRYSIQRDMAEAYGDAPLNVPELPEVGFGKLRTEELRRRYGVADDAVWRKLSALRMTSDDGGLDPDVVAELFGFGSGDELVQKLTQAEPPKSVIEGRTDQRMLEEHGDLATPAGLERAADAAIHNDARVRFVATELRALQHAMSVREKVPGQKNTVDVLARAAKDYATAIVAKLKVRDIRPSQYAAAEARSAKAAAKAVGDVAQATMHKRNQLINLYATKAAYAAQDEVKAAVLYFKKFDGVSKTLDMEYAEQIHALLERFDLRVSTSLKALDKRKSLVEWAQAQVDQGLEPDIPPELLQEANRKSFKDMTVEEVRGLRDTIKQIEHLGRLKNRLLTSQSTREFNAVVDEMTTSIELEAGDRKADTRTPNTVLGAKLIGLKNFWAEHIKAATWARIMDGGKDGGPVWEYLIRTANTAGDTEVVMREKATKELAKLVAPVLKEGKMGGKGEFYPSINRTLNKEAKLAIALNMGNESNAQRLLGGEGWSLQQLQPVLNSLSAADWQFVQAIWDHFESYRPAIGAKEKRVYGKEPNWVEPVPVHTPYGTLRGGYYPIKYDPRASERAESHADAEEAKRQLAGAYTSATTRRSFTKTRSDEVHGRPLLYSLDGIYNGVQEVIHDLTWHEWLIDANKLVKNKKIAEAMRSKYGPDAHQQFKRWLEDNAAGDRGAQGAGEKALAYIRQGVSVSGLGLNVMSALMQPLGITQSMVRIGPKWVGKGVAKFLGSPIDTADAINEKSEFMRTRALTRLREINEVRSQVKGRTAAREAVDASAYFLMMRCQQAVDIPTWWGAYEKAISEGNDESRAVALSDQAVIDAQGSGGVKDQSAIERGGPGIKLFTTFYSFFNTALNLGVQKTMSHESKAKLAADYLLLYSIPVILGAALKDALTGGDSGDWDDWGHIVKRLAGEHLSFLLGLFVGVREVTGAVQAATGTSQFGTDYSGPAGVRMLADLVKLGKQMNQGELDDGLRKAVINTAGELLRLPAAQINRTINGIEALHDGKTQNPGVLLTGYQEPH